MKVQEGLAITGLAFLVLGCILGFILVLSLGTHLVMGLTIATSWCIGVAVVCLRQRHRLVKEQEKQGKVRK